MKTTLSTITSTALTAAIVASSAIASASAAELTASDVWNPAPKPKDPPFKCIDEQPGTMIKSVPGGAGDGAQGGLHGVDVVGWLGVVWGDWWVGGGEEGSMWPRELL